MASRLSKVYDNYSKRLSISADFRAITRVQEPAAKGNSRGPNFRHGTFEQNITAKKRLL